MKQSLFLVLLFISIFSSLFAQNQPGRILNKMHQFSNTGRVLYLAAHPDDENTRLISYLVNSRHYRTAYLSMTRGDGGQNLIGNEQTEELGLIRTQELLRARSIDGGEQYFTRANDFGYSKNPEETFEIWNSNGQPKPDKGVEISKSDLLDNEILKDVVWVIRNFRPDIIVTRFPTTGEGGHGHHTASAILAVEAFKLAADKDVYPEQLKYVQPWQTKRIFWNNFMRWRDPNADMSGTLPLEINEYIPELGESIGEIAAYSRSSHRSQGFGSRPQYEKIEEFFSLLGGDEAKEDIMEGIETNWDRIPGSTAIKAGSEKLINEFKINQPEASVPLLLKINAELKKMADFPEKEFKLKQVADLILLCSGVHVEYNSETEELSQGEIAKTKLVVTLRSAIKNVEIEKIEISGVQDLKINKSEELSSGSTFEREIELEIPRNADFTNPYWLEKPHSQGRFVVDNQEIIGQADVSDALTANIEFTIEGNSFTSSFPLNYRWIDPSRGELVKPCVVVPQISATIFPNLSVLSGNDVKEVRVEVKGENLVGSDFMLDVPSSIFTVEPSHIVILDDKKIHTFNFKVRVSNNRMLKPDDSWDVQLLKIRNGDTSVVQTITKIDYEHIPQQTWTKPASIKLVHVNLVKKGNNIAYIDGAGDKVDECLSNAGYHVTMLNDEDIRLSELKKYDAVIIGIRAFNTRENMDLLMPEILTYVKQGGNLIVQYNTKNWISDVQVAPGPYPLTVSRDRITDENAPLEILEPEHSVFNYPNKITSADFEGWVQERGLYFPDKWDEKYIPLLAGNDPGESVKKGILLTTKYGEGHYVYTGISFFRELPAGVPGAYRLIANLIALGNEQQ